MNFSLVVVIPDRRPAAVQRLHSNRRHIVVVLDRNLRACPDFCGRRRRLFALDAL